MILSIKAKSLLPYHEHNADTIRPKIISLIKSGKSIALVSDAGSPLVSDPGYRLVRECVKEDIYITSCPGATALITALQLSGLPSDSFLFYGFLPPKKNARIAKLNQFKELSSTLIFYESPHRLKETLEDMASVFKNRDAAVVRELTKKFEQVVRLPLPELCDYYQENGEPKGEIVIVIAPYLKEEDLKENAENLIKAEELLSTLLPLLSVKDASTVVASHYGVSKKELYAKALKLKEQETKD